MKFNTKLLHGKAGRNTPDGATLPGISQVSAFSYDSAEHLEKVFGNKAPGFAYTRIGNPTVAAFEQRINEVAVSYTHLDVYKRQPILQSIKQQLVLRFGTIRTEKLISLSQVLVQAEL